MKKLIWIYKNMIIVYGLVLIGVIILSFQGISFYSQDFKYICYGLYFVLSIITLKSVYFNKNNIIHKICIFILPILSILLLFIDKLLIIPIILMMFILILKKEDEKIIYVIFYIFIILIGIVVFSITTMFDDFREEKIERTYYSYDKTKRIMVVSVDLGAIGGGVKVILEKTYLGLFKTQDNIYIGPWNDKPYIRWIDNNSIQIKDKVIKIE
ncbi:DUF5412 family protein [Anaerophilus nitritogenes]|uniref:DUF5412 family protein n=1 Tax=Anaerophilus nitritogenes TaxID=2498136 RepID=UPI00101E1933|nr:DUF5412 family protein [Anaerophilus nitritogenes]